MLVIEKARIGRNRLDHVCACGQAAAYVLQAAVGQISRKTGADFLLEEGRKIVLGQPGLFGGLRKRELFGKMRADKAHRGCDGGRNGCRQATVPVCVRAGRIGRAQGDVIGKGMQGGIFLFLALRARR